MAVHLKFVAREIRHSPKQAVVFISCVALSIVGLITLSAFSRSVDRYLSDDARRLHGGDVIVHSHQPFSPAMEAALRQLPQRGAVHSTRIREFYSLVRTEDDGASILAQLKAVDSAYPLYGRLTLRSGGRLASVLTAGRVVVQREVLERLGLEIGDALKIGDRLLTIADVVVSEPDRPVSFFSFGPRVFVSSADLESLNLVRDGSRVSYQVLLKTPPGTPVEAVAADLRKAAVADQEQVDTYRSAGSRIRRFLDNFMFFLSLVGVFTLILAGIGIQGALAALVREKEKTIAAMKTLGATARFVMLHFLLVFCFLGLTGILVGITAAAGLQLVLPALFEGLLPPDLALSLSWPVVAEAALIGGVVVILFGALPLLRLRDIRPARIFGNDARPPFAGRLDLLATAVAAVCFTAMVLRRAGDLRLGLYFLAAAALMICGGALCTAVLLRLLRRSRIRNLALRQAVRGLFRPRNATASIVVTLSASLTMIFAIHLIERNLDATFVRSFPPDSPNLFFLDIQPSQKDAFQEALGIPAVYYPVIRSRLVSINGKAIDLGREKRRRGDNLARTFNLTYRDHLLTDEVLVAGAGLFDPRLSEPQVSILDTVAEIHPMKIGDRLAFKIQGIPLTAVVSSIRGRSREGLAPFFYFVFPEKDLASAPQMIFTAVRVPVGQLAALQNRIAARFPNVSAVDVTRSIADLAELMHRLSSVVRFFAAFSILAGLLIIVGSVFATRVARAREAVYYKILGARAGFVLKVFAMENALLGMASALLAVIFSQLGAWLTVTRVLDIGYRPFAADSLAAAAGAALLISTVGLIPSAPLLGIRPARFLRSHSQE